MAIYPYKIYSEYRPGELYEGIADVSSHRAHIRKACESHRVNFDSHVVL